MTNSPRHQEHNNTHSHTHKKNTHTAKKKELRRTRRIHGRNRRYPEEKEGFGIPFFFCSFSLGIPHTNEFQERNVPSPSSHLCARSLPSGILETTSPRPESKPRPAAAEAATIPPAPPAPGRLRGAARARSTKHAQRTRTTQASGTEREATGLIL
jgi:hypothetical protein